MLTFNRAFSIVLTFVLTATCARGEAPSSQEVRDRYDQMVAKAMSYLATKGRSSDGSYSSSSGPAVTALVTTGLLRNGRSPNEAFVAESLK